MTGGPIVEMTVPLVSRGNGRWGSTSPAWDHLINRESSGIPDIIQQITDVNSGGNEAEGLFQITPKCVPLESQIVTRRGILRHDQVVVGDQTIGYNPQTGRSEWTEVLEVCHFDAAPVFRVGRGKWYAECTINHRWVTLRSQRPESLTSCPHCGWSGNPRTGLAATPRSVSTHMGRAHGVKQGDIAWKGRFELVESNRLTPHHSILLAAAANTGRELAISDQESAIIGWIVSDGHIRKAGNSYSASIWQSKPEQVAHLEELLADVPHGRSARWTKLSKIGPSHTFRLSQSWVTELVKRAELDISNIAGFVLRLSPSQRSAFLDAVVRAEGHTRDGLTRIAQAEGDRQDAIALAVYLAGYHPSFTPLSGKSNLTSSPRPAHQVGMSRPYRTIVALTSTGRVEPVWCVRTRLGTWTMRQGKRIMLTGNTWRANNGQQFAASARLATPQQQAIVAARIFTRNPTGSDWGAGRPGREDPSQLAAGLVPLNPQEPAVPDNRPDFNEINEIGLDNGNHASVRSRPPMNFFLHTEQPAGTGLGAAFDDSATRLSAYLRSTSGNSAVSYHYTIRQATDGGVTVVDVVDTDLYSWAVLNANVFSINLCFAGSKAEWTRDQWMTQKNAIRVAAYIAVQDARKYNFSTEVILPPYGNARQGISDHRYVTECLGFGNHTDVGGPEAPPWTGFPWDYFVDCVNEFTNNAPVVTQPVPVTPVPVSDDPFLTWLKGASDRQVLEYIAAQQGPGDPNWASKGMTPRDKLWAIAAKVGA